jgi:hypothetical protein
VIGVNYNAFSQLFSQQSQIGLMFHELDHNQGTDPGSTGPDSGTDNPDQSTARPDSTPRRCFENV